MSQVHSVPKQYDAAYTQAQPSDAPKATGLLSGRVAKVLQTPKAMLQDALEEVSASIHRSEKFGLDKLKERNRSKATERAKAFQKLSAEGAEGEERGENQEQLEMLLEMVEQGVESTILLEKALEFASEPEDAWCALELVRERASKHESIDEALYELNNRFGAAIRAGVTGTLAAEDFVSLGLPRDLGREYKKAVLEFTSTTELYKQVVDAHKANFLEAVEYLEKALNMDVNAHEPSLAREVLTTFGSSVARLRTFRTAALECAKLALGSLDGDTLLTGLLEIGNAAYPSAYEVQKLAQKTGETQIDVQIHFLQNLLGAVRRFSVDLFENQDGRNKLLMAVQSSVDEAINREDALLN